MIFSVIGFVIALCFAAGFLVATRAAKTTSGVVLLGLLFGFVFVIALCGIAFAGCVALLSTS